MSNHYYNKTITNSTEETKSFARNFAKILDKKDTVLLTGGLGMGKTTFTVGIGEYFKIHNIKSPTFTIVNRYTTNKGFYLYHIDLYRIKENNSLFNIELYEYIEDGLALIEWGEVIKQNLNNFYDIKIKYIEDNIREIIIEYISF